MTVDLRQLALEVGDQEIVRKMIGRYPFETTVYRLLPADEPLHPYEEVFGAEVYVNEQFRRDFLTGDLYLSRSRTLEGAALEHDAVVDALKKADLTLLTQSDRMAIYGIGDTLD